MERGLLVVTVGRHQLPQLVEQLFIILEVVAVQLTMVELLALAVERLQPLKKEVEEMVLLVREMV
jgi:hypothetical protein